ncbi:MAG: choice-of-anchor D domain-containing protein [Candidatus Nanopelagicales bacterium]
MRRFAATWTVLVTALVGFVLAPAPAMAEEIGWGSASQLSGSGEAYGPEVAVSTDGRIQTSVWAVVDAGAQTARASTTSDGGLTWTTITLSNPSASAYSPRIAASADGLTQTAIWYEYAGAGFVLRAAASTDGGANWATGTLSTTGVYNYDPDISVSADGQAQTAVWVEIDGTGAQVGRAATSVDFGATWNATTLSATGMSAFELDIAVSGDGRVQAVVWSESDGSAYRQRAASTTDGAHWATTTLSAGGGYTTAAHIAISADGQIQTAVWYEYVDSVAVVRSATSDDTGATWTATTLSTPDVNAYAPRIAVSADGRTQTALWYEFTAAGYVMRAATSTDAAGAWVTRDLSYPSTYTVDPRVDVSADGRTQTAVWTGYTGRDPAVYAATATNAAASSWTITTLSTAAADALHVRIAVAGDGQSQTAVWQETAARRQVVRTGQGKLLRAGFAADPLDFGNVGLGTTAERMMIVTNPGEGTLLTNSVELLGPDAARFTLDAQPCTHHAVPAGHSCAMSITFHPEVPGEHSAQLRFANNTATGSYLVALSGAGIANPARTPQFAAPVASAAGFTVAITNFDPAWTWTPTVVTPAGATVTSDVSDPAKLTVVGLAPGQAATIQVETTRPGYERGDAPVTGSALTGAARTPVFSTPVATAAGFTVTISNYDPAWSWTPAVLTPSGADVAMGAPSGSNLPLTVSGLRSGQSATIAVQATRTGYLPGSGQVTGTALPQVTPSPPPPASPTPSTPMMPPPTTVPSATPKATAPTAPPMPTPAPPSPSIPTPNPLGPNSGNADHALASAVWVTLNGQPAAARLALDKWTGLAEITGTGFRLTYQARTMDGRVILPVGGLWAISPGQLVAVAGTGLTPGAAAQIHMFTTPVTLSTAVTGAGGALAATLAVPAGPPGNHVLQTNAFAANEQVQSISLRAYLAPEITAQATGRTKLKIAVGPKCRAQYKVRILRRIPPTSQRGSTGPIAAATYQWATKAHRTKGRTSTLTIDLPKGTYRAHVLGGCGRAGITTNWQTLKR